MHRNTLTFPIEMGGLALRDIDTQCKVIQCSIIAKLHKEIQQGKVRIDLTLWHLNQYRDAKQDIFLFQILYWEHKQGADITNLRKISGSLV